MKENKLKEAIEYITLYAQTHREEELQKQLEHFLIDHPETKWNLIGNDEVNQGRIEGLNCTPMRALTEIIVNSIESIYINELKKKNLTMNTIKNITTEDVEDILLDNRTFYELSKEEQEEWKSKINIFYIQNNKFKGKKEKTRTFVICDKGGGFSKESLTNVCKAESGEKHKIKWCLGMFHMGMFGVFSFCGTNKHVIIASKQDPLIYKNPKWVWTVFRKNFSNDYEGRNSPYEYLCYKNGELITFEGSFANIQPTWNGEKNEIKFEKSEWGTFLILTEFGRGENLYDAKVKNALNFYLWDLSIPFFYIHPSNSRMGRITKRENITGGDIWLRKIYDQTHNDVRKYGPIEITVHIKQIPIKTRVYLMNQYDIKGKDNKNFTDQIGKFTEKDKKTNMLLKKISHSLLGIQESKFTKFSLRNIFPYMFCVIEVLPLIEKHKEYLGEIFKTDRESIQHSPLTEKVLRKLKEALESSEKLKEFDEIYKKEQESYFQTNNTQIKIDIEGIYEKYANLIKEYNGKDIIDIQESKKKPPKKEVELKEGEIKFTNGKQEKHKFVPIERAKKEKLIRTRFIGRCKEQDLLIVGTKKLQDDYSIEKNGEINFQLNLYPSKKINIGEREYAYIIKKDKTKIRIKHSKRENKLFMIDDYIKTYNKNKTTKRFYIDENENLIVDFIDSDSFLEVKKHNFLKLEMVFNEQKQKQIREKPRFNLTQPSPEIVSKDFLEKNDLDDEWIGGMDRNKDKIYISLFYKLLEKMKQKNLNINDFIEKYKSTVYANVWINDLKNNGEIKSLEEYSKEIEIAIESFFIVNNI